MADKITSYGNKKMKPAVRAKRLKGFRCVKRLNGERTAPYSQALGAKAPWRGSTAAVGVEPGARLVGIGLGRRSRRRDFVRTGGIRVHIPTGPAPIGNRLGGGPRNGTAPNPTLPTLEQRHARALDVMNWPKGFPFDAVLVAGTADRCSRTPLEDSTAIGDDLRASRTPSTTRRAGPQPCRNVMKRTSLSSAFEPSRRLLTR
jgi:hypothetical protein